MGFVSLSINYISKLIPLFRYYIRDDAERAISLLNNTYLDNRIIRIDWDTGFVEGRQYGRGWSGAQKRDELNRKYDPDRPRENYNSIIFNNVFFF